MNPDITIREFRPEEFDALGRLLVEVYACLEGFPTRKAQPQYYAMLANIGQFTEKPATKVLVALSDGGEVVGKLTEACMDLAKADGHPQVILHTTQSMQVAWKLYERVGFKRSEDLDFMQGTLPVFGFRFDL